MKLIANIANEKTTRDVEKTKKLKDQANTENKKETDIVNVPRENQKE